MVPFWGRCTTHFSLFEWGLGCLLGVLDFDPWPHGFFISQGAHSPSTKEWQRISSTIRACSDLGTKHLEGRDSNLRASSEAPWAVPRVAVLAATFFAVLCVCSTLSAVAVIWVNYQPETCGVGAIPLISPTIWWVNSVVRREQKSPSHVSDPAASSRLQQFLDHVRELIELDLPTAIGIVPRVSGCATHISLGLWIFAMGRYRILKEAENVGRHQAQRPQGTPLQMCEFT